MKGALEPSPALDLYFKLFPNAREAEHPYPQTASSRAEGATHSLLESPGRHPLASLAYQTLDAGLVGHHAAPNVKGVATSLHLISGLA